MSRRSSFQTWETGRRLGIAWTTSDRVLSVSRRGVTMDEPLAISVDCPWFEHGRSCVRAIAFTPTS